MLDTSGWQGFRIGNLFDSITKAESYSKDALDSCDVFNDFAISYVTRTNENNAVDAFVVNNGFSGLERGNAIVIGDTTSTISYQPDDFIAGSNIVVMRARWLNVLTGLFLVSLLQKERFRYSYGRAFIMPLIADTVVKFSATSDGQSDWTWMEKFMSQYYQGPLQSQNQPSGQRLSVDKWQEFRVGNLFDVKKGKRLTAEDQSEGENLYISATGSNNGVSAHIGQQPIHDGNTISLSWDGSIGEAFYQPDPFWATDRVNVLYLKPSCEMNKFVGLFICAILRQEKYRFAYGRKWTLDSMRDTVIRLPATTDAKGCVVPDWVWMEQYMRSLPYSDLIEDISCGSSAST